MIELSDVKNTKRELRNVLVTCRITSKQKKFLDDNEISFSVLVHKTYDIRINYQQLMEDRYRNCLLSKNVKMINGENDGNV